MGNVMQILYEHEAKIGDSETWGDKRTAVNANMPLRELMRNFFDELKSASSGFASLSYEITGSKEADVVRLDILIAEEVVPAFSRVISKGRVEEDGRSAVERLHAVLPKQLFVVKIQAKSLGRIIASETLSAMRKDVTAKLYGGDITRKMKLLEKQKKEKEDERQGACGHSPRCFSENDEKQRIKPADLQENGGVKQNHAYRHDNSHNAPYYFYDFLVSFAEHDC